MWQARLLESCAQISCAVVHFGIDWLLQSTLLLALGLVAARLLRAKGAAMQSVIYRMTLAAVLVCPLVPLLLGAAGMRRLALHWAAETPAAYSLAGETMGEMPATDGEAAPGGRQAFLADRMGGSNRQIAADATLTHPSAVPGTNLRRVGVLSNLSGIHWSPLLHPLLAAAWLLGSSGLAIRLFLGWRSARQLRRSACPADAHTTAECRALAARMNVHAPQLLRSGFAASPSLLGVFCPTVLLPEEENARTDDREVLVHELAHLARGDQVWSLAGHAATAVLFFQPLLWLLVRRMVLAAEEVCDDHVLGLGFDRPAYARRLVDVAERYQPVPALALGMVSLRSRTSQRVVRILDASRQLSTHTSRRVKAFVAAAALVVAVATGAMSVDDHLVAAPAAPQDPHAASADVSQVDNVIDTTYMIEKTWLIVVLRPAAGFARPGLAALAKCLEQPLNVLPKGARLADFRQITLVVPEAKVPVGPREMVAFQSVKPIAAGSFQRGRYTAQDFRGKKMCVGSDNGFVALQYDDHTVVTAGSEQALGVYLAGNLGVLPKWLPAKSWGLLRSDHLVIAGDPAMIRREMKPVTDGSAPPLVRAAFVPIASVCQDATGLAAGMRLDETLTVDAWLAGKNADSAENLQRMAEALKTLAESFAKDYQAPSEIARLPQPKVVSLLLAEADRLLRNVTFHKEGDNVLLRTSIELGKARLEALVSAIVAATEPPDPGTKSGMMALVEDFFHHNWRDITSRETIAWGETEKTKDGNFSIRYKYRASYWWGAPKVVNQVFTFNRQGAFVSVNDAEKGPPPTPAKVYKVDKKVSDFPNREDLSTPEAAYVTINRAYATEGDAAWPRLSVPWLAAHMPGGAKRPLPKQVADRFLAAEILEVHVWDGTHGEGNHAVVLAREESGTRGHYSVDMRWLNRVEGRWLNEGNEGRRTLEEARQKVEQSRSR